MAVPYKEITDETWLAYDPATNWAWDFFSTREEADDMADRLYLEKGKPYAVARFGEFLDLSRRAAFAASPLVEITPEFYGTQLCVLPPLYRPGAWGWFMSEFTSGSLTHQYVTRGGRFFSALVDITDPATWITPDKVDAMPKGAPVYSWFGKLALAAREMHAGDLSADGVGFYLEPRRNDPPREAVPAARRMKAGDLLDALHPAALWAIGAAWSGPWGES